VCVLEPDLSDLLWILLSNPSAKYLLAADVEWSGLPVQLCREVKSTFKEKL
jgi:hypothetical protein